jgi:hypothetical protein
MRIVATIAALVVVGTLGSVIGAGCSPTTSGSEGVSCTEQSDCTSGLQCVPYLQINEVDGGCSILSSECLQTCATDEDCANVAFGFTCMTQCGGTPVCEPPMTIPSDASPSIDAAAADAATPVDAQGQ